MRSLLASLFVLALVASAAARPPAFLCRVVGSAGGVTQDDLSCYLIAAPGSTNYTGLDAGTAPLDPPVTSWLISHAHLDHVAGLVITSTDNAKASVLGLDPTIDVLRDDLFNWRVWPNFGSEGARPLGHYTYVRLSPGRRVAVSGTPFTVEAWPLSHGGVTSTAFLVFNQLECLAYFGDTGPEGDALADVWARLAPIERAGHLRGVFIECSYPDPRPDNQLFGHLTPVRLLAQLRHFAQLAGPLEGLTVLVTHIKPAPDSRAQVEKGLREANDLGVRFLFPRQGDRISL